MDRKGNQGRRTRPMVRDAREEKEATRGGKPKAAKKDELWKQQAKGSW